MVKMVQMAGKRSDKYFCDCDLQSSGTCLVQMRHIALKSPVVPGNLGCAGRKTV